MTDEADIILAQIRAKRAESHQQEQGLSPDLKRFVAVLELPHFVFIEVHAASEERVREWFDCPDGGFPQTVPTMRDAMKKLPWKQRHSFGGKSIPKVRDVSEVEHIDIPGFYVGQTPSEKAIREGYINVDDLVFGALEENARKSVFRWAVADKKTREVIAVFRTRDEARAARKEGQIVDRTTNFSNWRRFV